MAHVNPYHGKNWAVFNIKKFGTTFGMYRWEKPGRGGVVFRAGPLGHVQLMRYYNKVQGGHRGETRRRKHGFALHWWGISGRHLKRGIDIGVIL